MALTSLLVKPSAAKLAYGDLILQFDAVLEDTLEASVTLSEYPLEVGVNSNDHRVINPTKWTITGAISSNPLTVLSTFFSGDASEVEDSTGDTSKTATIFSQWLTSSTDSSRPTDALKGLMEIMKYGDPFSVDAGDITLSNMVIEKIYRTKDADNETALIFTAELREWQSIETAVNNATSTTSAATGTATASAAANFKNNGEVSTTDATDTIKDYISGWFI